MYVYVYMYTYISFNLSLLSISLVFGPFHFTSQTPFLFPTLKFTPSLPSGVLLPLISEVP